MRRLAVTFTKSFQLLLFCASRCALRTRVGTTFSCDCVAGKFNATVGNATKSPATAVTYRFLISHITPRHTVRPQSNSASLRKACSESGQRLLVCHAEDSIKNRPLSLLERYALVQHSAGDGRRKRKDLPETIELASRMKVMVTSNIGLDITNGARATIVDIVLNQEAPPLAGSSWSC
jgi:hypothetical protein